MWHLPLEGDHKDFLRSALAYIANVGGRWGGAVTAAMFLRNSRPHAVDPSGYRGHGVARREQAVRWWVQRYAPILNRHPPRVAPPQPFLLEAVPVEFIQPLIGIRNANPVVAYDAQASAQRHSQRLMPRSQHHQDSCRLRDPGL